MVSNLSIAMASVCTRMTYALGLIAFPRSGSWAGGAGRAAVWPALCGSVCVDVVCDEVFEVWKVVGDPISSVGQFTACRIRFAESRKGLQWSKRESMEVCRSTKLRVGWCARERVKGRGWKVRVEVGCAL